MKISQPGKMIHEVLSSLFKKPATLDYPNVKPPVHPSIRGAIKFESGKCIGCKLCMKDCPANAIQIRQVGEKKYEAEFDLSKCIYCAQCVDSCPRKALQYTQEFELAALNHDKLKVIFHVDPPAKEPEKQA
jgi:formate hydrogenlyase subunit 6/NADH:ubiquinone oxidoreductase subunit I